ncbi:hypothetical protein ACHAWC_009630 [Mediolabrus comicus]
MQLFDAHSHMHMGPRGLEALLESFPHVMEEQSSPQHSFRFAGAAIMSTVPADYRTVDSVVSGLRMRGFQAVPCYGIHPWFLHDVLSSSSRQLDWLVEDLQQNLIDHPDAIVGEIGLDGSRWVEVKRESHYHQSTTTSQEEESIWKRERVLACPMDLQRKAFEEQLILAVELQRPVSIHVVNAWGELFAAFDNVCARMKDKQLIMGKEQRRRRSSSSSSSRRSTTKLLPPKIYFHAFSGKVGTLPSIIAACKKGHVASEDIYFGFAPAIPNFNSAKTPLIMKEIGMKQLLLETDLEDATTAMDDLIHGVSKISNALGMEESEVARQTVENAYRFYCHEGLTYGSSVSRFLPECECEDGH